MKRKAILAAGMLLVTMLFVSGCAPKQTPYEINDQQNYNISVKYDANGGLFTDNTTVIVDSYNASDLTANDQGQVEIALLPPSDPGRGTDAFTARKNGYFLAGWYAEREETVDDAGNISYTYGGKWDFENDLLKLDANGRWDRSQRDTMKSAIGVLSTMLVFQNAGTTKSAYYDADSRSEFFGALTDFTHKPRNHYHSLKAFKLLRRGETECETTGETDNVRICAAGNGKEHWVCITCEDADTKLSFKPAGIEACKVRWGLLDETHKLEVVRTGRFNGRAIPMKLEANSAVLLEFLAE